MHYKLFDANNNEVTQHDLQDKGPWCLHGVSKENSFISQYGNKFNLVINPEKANNIYAPDIFNTTTKLVGDLKTQNTPFFTATKYGIDIQYAVTFNVKDYERYLKSYPQIEIYFWVSWEVISFENDYAKKRVNPMTGVWFIKFENLKKLIEKAPVHSYMQRQNDQKGNARESYVLNLNDMTRKI